MATRRPARSRRPFLPLTVTLTPDSGPPSEAWCFALRGGQGGVLIGILYSAARAVLRLAQVNGWRSVRLRIPKARWFGLGARVVMLADNSDAERLRVADVLAVRRRHDVPEWPAREVRRAWGVAAAVRVLGWSRAAWRRVSLPGVWPAP